MPVIFPVVDTCAYETPSEQTVNSVKYIKLNCPKAHTCARSIAGPQNLCFPTSFFGGKG